MLATWGTSTGRNPTLDLQFAGATSLDDRITFSRGSQATLFDSTGALVYAKHNLLLQSEDFSTTWSAVRSSVSVNQTMSPAGTLTADKIIEDSSVSITHFVRQDVAVVSGVAYTWSVFAKADTRSEIQLAFGADNGCFPAGDAAIFTLTGAGSVTVVAGSPNATIQALANGWYRCSVRATCAATATGIFRQFLANGGTASYTGDGTSGLFMWGSQLNFTAMEGGVTSSLSTYYPTVASAYYAPRFDYNPSTFAAQGLLIEEQRTNSIRNNTMQGAVAGTPGTSPTNWTISTTNAELVSSVIGTGTESGITYIDVRISGTMTASRDLDIAFDVSNNIAALSGQAWSESVYLREVGGSQTNISAIYLQANTYTAALAYVNSPWFAAKTVTAAALATQRFSESQTLSGATIAFIQPLIKVRTAASGAVNFTLRIGLPQLEQGAFATSVIPTTTTALTRNADVASMTGTNFSSWFNASEGTIVSTTQLANTVAANRAGYDINDNSTNNRIIFRVLTTGGGDQSTIRSGGITQVQDATATAPTTAVRKSAIAYKVNDFAFVANAGAVVADNSGAVPVAPTQILIGAAQGGVEFTGGYIQRISYYPVRLPNSTLQALTA